MERGIIQDLRPDRNRPLRGFRGRQSKVCRDNGDSFNPLGDVNATAKLRAELKVSDVATFPLGSTISVGIKGSWSMQGPQYKNSRALGTKSRVCSKNTKIDGKKPSG